MPSATVYDDYIAANARLARGERLFFHTGSRGGSLSPAESPRARPVRYPGIGVYTGEGASHSWLWFVEMFDRMGFHDVRFLNASDIQNLGPNDLDVLAVSGGDTFAIAEALGPRGADHLGTFIENGGLYIGSCAGAYLVMRSSKPHLNLFNFTSVTITNLSKRLPDFRVDARKFAMAYGCDYIFHPAREAVRIRPTGKAPFGAPDPLDAPLYGGPGMIPSETDAVLASYDGFTDKTVFLVDRATARETLLGKAAAIRARLGRGALYLLGPHFEHPRFPGANRLVAEMVYWDGARKSRESRRPTRRETTALSRNEGKRLVKDLKRELSNSRIVTVGLEMKPIAWLLGNKYYEPEKIRVFLEAMWRRIKRLEKSERLRSGPGAPDRLSRHGSETTNLLRKLKRRLDRNEETHPLAEELFPLLRRFTTMFLDLYFRTIYTPA